MTHATAVNPGKGVALQVTISAALTAVAQLESIDGPEMKVGVVETTNLSSSAKTYRPTIVDNGTVSGSLQFDPQDPTHAELLLLIGTPPQAGNAMAVVFTDTTVSTASFTGILTSLKPTAESVDDNLMADFEIQISGAVTWTHA